MSAAKAQKTSRRTPKRKAAPPAPAKPVGTVQRMEKKRCAILDAALKLFSTRGFHGTPVPLVADTAGVAAGTIYTYFPSKEALVNALYQQCKTGFRDLLAVAVPPAAAPRAQFAALWAALVQFQKAEPRAFDFCELHYHAPYLDAPSLALEDDVLAIARAWCEQGKAQGALKSAPTDLLIAVVFGAFVNVIKQQELGRLAQDAAVLAAAEACCWDAIAN